MNNSPPQNSQFKGRFLPLLTVFIACSVLLGSSSGSIWIALIAYPFISIFPCLFLLSLLGKRPVDFGVILPAAVMIGPVFSALVGVAVLYIRPNMDAAVWAIMIVGFALGASNAVLKREWVIPRPGLSWLPAILFAGFTASLVVIVCVQGIQMRLYHDGWFHSAVAHKIMQMGVPPEDPVFPGETAHNYWFYHAWGAILSWAFQRPPADMYSFINVHALLGVILGVWLCAAQLFRRNSERVIALFFAILGMNALGSLFMIFNRVRGVIFLPGDNQRPSLLQYMFPYTYYGDGRIPQFLVKFIPSNGFPLGIVLYVSCLFLVIHIFRKGASAPSVSSFFLAVLGVLLFHPTTGLGLGAGMIGGLVITALLHPDRRRVSVFLVIVTGAGCVISMPYLLSIFPSQTEKMEAAISGRNAAFVILSYLLMTPFIIRGTRNLYLSRDPAAIFTIGCFGGVLAAALFLILPGLNQYKFVQLLAIPAGILSAAAFTEDSSKKIKKALFSIFLIFTFVNIVIVEYAYLSSSWWREERFKVEGVHVAWLKEYQDDMALYEWVRASTPANSILVARYKPYDVAFFAQRSIISPIDNWVSKGHRGDNERRQIVERLFSGAPFSAKDIDALKDFKRPVYFAILPGNDRAMTRAEKFDGRPELFRLVFNRNGRRLYYLLEK